MTKAKLITALAYRTGQTKAQAKKMLETFLDLITDSLQNGERVILMNFGSFYVQQTKGRKGYNLVTGQPLAIKPKKRVRFKAGAELSAHVNR